MLSLTLTLPLPPSHQVFWKDGFGTCGVHGDKQQAERESALRRFTADECPLMFKPYPYPYPYPYPCPYPYPYPCPYPYPYPYPYPCPYPYPYPYPCP